MWPFAIATLLVNCISVSPSLTVSVQKKKWFCTWKKRTRWSAPKNPRLTLFKSYLLHVWVLMFLHVVCVYVCVCRGGGCLCRAVTVLNTLYKGQRAAMTSQDCRWGPPTTSCCLSWVRRLRSSFDALMHKSFTFRLTSTVSRRPGLQQPEPGAHGAPHRYRAAGGGQADQPGRVHGGGAAAAYGGPAYLKGSESSWNVPVSRAWRLTCVPNPRTKSCSPDGSATRTCSALAWFSAPVVSSGSSPPSWPMVSSS